MRIFLLILLILSCAFTAWGLDLEISQISDDSLLRLQLKDIWFTESPAKALAQRSSLYFLESGERVFVSTEESKNEFMVLISRELMSGSIATDKNPAVPRQGTGKFPGWAQGSWMLIREKETGKPSMIRIFLRSDQYTYIQFRPFNNEKCLMDAIVYGGIIIRSLPVAVPFERLYTMPLNDILKLAGDKFPRRYFDPNPVYYKDNRKFVSLVRAKLPGLRFADDGAIDENGNYVLIKTLQAQKPASAGLNCSGFTKWLIDGILRPVTGKRLNIAQLKAPFGERGSSFTVNWEERLDPFFGLDWIRNLASISNSALRAEAYGTLDEFEIRTDAFSSLMVNENRTFVVHSYPGFLKEAGFGVEGLHALLYTLAVDDPFKFYLAAVSMEIGLPVTRDNLRGAPVLRRYFHVAALVPYFDEYGNFRVTVFESAAETSFNGFKSRHGGRYINLVQIPVVTVFEP